MTRCLMPPENWCGYSSARRSGSGMPMALSRSTARAPASRRPRPWWSSRTSAICLETLITGFREVRGSWNIMEMLLPLRTRTSSSVAWMRSRETPLRSVKTTFPSAMNPGGLWTSLMMERFVTDLPEPDSPTMPRVSPRRRSNEMPSTAFTRPVTVRNWVLRFSTLRIISSLMLPSYCTFLRRGSRRSRSPSPRRLNPSTRNTIASPG